MRDGERLRLVLDMPAARRIRFDFARHKRVLNFDTNYIRLNESPEWFVVDENRLYRLRDDRANERILLGSELVTGIVMEPGRWVVEPVPPPAVLN